MHGFSEGPAILVCNFNTQYVDFVRTMEMIQKPVEHVANLFLQAGCPLNDSESWGVEESFRDLVRDPNVLAQVPYMTEQNVDLLPHNSLVRFRGMVQDMPNPEFYLGALQRPDGTWVTSKFHDLAGLSVLQCHDSRIWERRSLLCVPVPGESAWCRKLRGGAEALLPAPQATGAVRVQKRGRADIADDNMAEDITDVIPATPDTQQSSKAGRLSECVACADAPGVEGGEFRQASAAGTSQRGSCMIMLYDKAGEECVLHDIVDVVAVLSKCPEFAVAHMANEGSEDDAMATDDVHDQLPPPTSQVPRLHAVLVERHASAASPSRWAVTNTVPAAVATSAAFAGHTEELRHRAMAVLALALGGDCLAAEYLLLQLLARVIARSGQQAFGMVPINMTHCPEPSEALGTVAAAVAAMQDRASGTSPPATAMTCVVPERQAPAVSLFAQAVVVAASALVPAVMCVPLSIIGLNAGPLAPRQCAHSGRISSSLLQLSPGTLMVVDETVMSEGRLGDAGTSNIQDLVTLVQEQVLLYDFAFHRQRIPVNLPLVVLSTTRSVMKDSLPIQLPLQPASSFAGPEAVAAALRVEDASTSSGDGSMREAGPGVSLTEVRAYLAATAMAPHALSDTMSALLQEEFIRKRKADSTYSIDKFDALLTLARLAALSFGESSMSEHTWQHVKAMEAKREARIRMV